MFTTNTGLTFTDPNFAIGWKLFLIKTAGDRFKKPFSATMARTLFIEGYTGALGMEPGKWEGCANMMGNSVGCYHSMYHPPTHMDSLGCLPCLFPLFFGCSKSMALISITLL